MEKKLDSQLIYDGKIIKLYKDDVSYDIKDYNVSVNVSREVTINAKNGYKYALIILFITAMFTDDKFSGSKDNGYGSFRVGSMDYDGLCSINSSLSDAESVGIIPLIPIKGNLPDYAICSGCSRSLIQYQRKMMRQGKEPSNLYRSILYSKIRCQDMFTEKSSMTGRIASLPTRTT